MPTGSGIVAPDSFPIRKPTDDAQNNGRVVNPVRYPEIGAQKKGGRWQGNGMRVEKPTDIKGSHSVAERKRGV